jgi:hypothetical protein
VSRPGRARRGPLRALRQTPKHLPLLPARRRCGGCGRACTRKPRSIAVSAHSQNVQQRQRLERGRQAAEQGKKGSKRADRPRLQSEGVGGGRALSARLWGRPKQGGREAGRAKQATAGLVSTGATRPHPRVEKRRHDRAREVEDYVGQRVAAHEDGHAGKQAEVLDAEAGQRRGRQAPQPGRGTAGRPDGDRGASAGQAGVRRGPILVVARATRRIRFQSLLAPTNRWRESAKSEPSVSTTCVVKAS